MGLGLAANIRMQINLQMENTKIISSLPIKKGNLIFKTVSRGLSMERAKEPSQLRSPVFFLKKNMDQSRPLFCSFSSLPHHKSITNWKKRRWSAWDSNPGPQNGRRRRNHGAMAATHDHRRSPVLAKRFSIKKYESSRAQQRSQNKKMKQPF